MSRRIAILSFAAALLFGVAGCDKIHEWPDNNPIDPSIIDTEIKIDVKMDIEMSQVITRSILSSTDTSAYDRRFVIEIYHNEPYDQSLVERDIITVPVSDFNTITLKTDLHALNYSVLVWSDYVLKGSSEDLFYHTEDLEHVRILENGQYAGCNMFKDCQIGSEDLDLTSYVDEWFSQVEFKMQLTRPVARIAFWATDINRYIMESGLEKEEGLSRAEIADRFLVKMIYPVYLPSSINVRSGKLNDSYTGYSFETGVFYDPQQEPVKLCYDYVFVNGDKSSIMTSLEIYDKVTGQLINATGNITVPTERGKETVVKDRFLTKDYSPGIGIDPGFDGEYNIYY